MSETELIRALKLLSRYLTRQQRRTIRGQILSGDVSGAMKGIKTILERGWEQKMRTVQPKKGV